MLGSTIIKDIRRLTGYKDRGISPDSDVAYVNDNAILEAMDRAISFIAVKQPRSFLKAVSLDSENMLGNDLFEIGNLFGWTPNAPTSPITPVEYPSIPVEHQKTSILAYYERGGMSNIYSGFPLFGFTYYPSEYQISLKNFGEVDSFVINPTNTITLQADAYLNTFSTSFLIYNESNGQLIDTMELGLVDTPTAIIKSPTGLILNIDYKNLVIVANLGAQNTESLRVVVKSANTNIFLSKALIYKGKIRFHEARKGNYRLSMQFYCRPYSIVTEDQEIAGELTGEMYELFLYTSAKELIIALGENSENSEVFNAFNDKLREFYDRESLVMQGTEIPSVVSAADSGSGFGLGGCW